MKIGQKITIERTQSGLYRLSTDDPNQAVLVGDAASTAISLIYLVFSDEANGDVHMEKDK
jgi:hypothetical protein